MWIGQAINECRTAYVHICKNHNEILAGINEKFKKSKIEIIIGSLCVIWYPVHIQKCFNL